MLLFEQLKLFACQSLIISVIYHKHSTFKIEVCLKNVLLAMIIRFIIFKIFNFKINSEVCCHFNVLKHLLIFNLLKSISETENNRTEQEHSFIEILSRNNAIVDEVCKN